MKEAPPDIFDSWIRQYIEDIKNVDVTTWEIFHRWGSINTVLKAQLLHLVVREDGSQILEEKSSDSASEVEEKASSDQLQEGA